MFSEEKVISNDDCISLNIGGSNFTTTRGTLLKDEDSMIAKLVQGSTYEGSTVPVIKDDKGAIFIDRDPTYFRYVVNYLRDGSIAPPESQDMRMEIYREAQFYGIQGLMDLLAGKVDRDKALGPENVALREAEDSAKDWFRSSNAEGAKRFKSTEPDSLMIDIFKKENLSTFNFVAECPIVDDSCIFTHLRNVNVGSLSVCSGIKQYQSQFDAFTGGVLKGLKWSNICCAGGSALAPLLVVPPGHSNARKLKEFYFGKDDQWFFAGPKEDLSQTAGFESSDVDLFLYGLSESDARDKISHIYDTIKKNTRRNCLCLRTGRSISFATGYPFRTIQVVLRLYESPAEVILGFDLDCVMVAYDGKRVYTLPRGRRALTTRCNVADVSRQTYRTNTYEYRLWKYSKRGFSVGIPGFKRELVDSAIFAKVYGELSGLARLLYLEARDFQRVISTQFHLSSKKPDQSRYVLENLQFSMSKDEEFQNFLEKDVVNKLIDYNDKTLLPFTPNMSVRKMIEQLKMRVFQLIAEAEANSTRASVSFVFGYSFQEISDTANFTISKRWEDDPLDFSLSIPKNIEFVGSLMEYIESLPEVSDDWYQDALKKFIL